MDAISYLLNRNQKSPKLLSAACLGLGVLSWLNINFLEFLNTEFPHLADVKLLAFFGVCLYCLSVVGAAASVVVALFGLPLSHVAKAGSTLRSWSENRILDELESTGLGKRYLVDQLIWFYAKRTFIVAMPTVIFSTLAYSPVDHVFLLGLIGLLPFLIAAACVVFTLTVWRISTGPKGFAFLLIPFTILVVPGFGLPYFSTSTLGAGSYLPVVWVVTLPFVVIATRFLSIYALENRSRFENLSLTWNRKTAIKQEGRFVTSDNAIIARQQMLGRAFSDSMTSSVLAIVLGLASMAAIIDKSPAPIYASLLLIGLVSAWRAAGRLSQSLTQEMEGSTLETIRTTPLGSERFLKGWLDIAVRPLAKEMILFTLVALPLAVWAGGMQVIYSGHFANSAALAILAPYFGGLFGASIAGQCRPRQEISGQITTSVVVGSLFCLPQLGIVLSEDYSWVSLILTLIVFRLAAWVLNAGAQKSLNRVFLPQK